MCTVTRHISRASPSCLKFLTGKVAMFRPADGPAIASMVRSAFLSAISSALLLGSVAPGRQAHPLVLSLRDEAARTPRWRHSRFADVRAADL